MAVEPETSTAAAYVEGYAAANRGSVRTENPYSAVLTETGQSQARGWSGGYDAGVKDVVQASLQVLPLPGGGAVPQPPLRRVLTVAELLACFTTKIQLVPGISRVAHVPLSCNYYHPAGSAYTIVGLTAFGCLVNNNLLCGNNGATILNAATETLIRMLGPGGSSALFSGVDIGGTAGLPLMFGALGANPAAGNFEITIEVTYEDVYFG